MHRKEKKPDDGYDVYRTVAKGYFKWAEEGMLADVPQTFGSNQEHDITPELKAKKQEEGFMCYPVAIEKLLLIPEALRTNKDKTNLDTYLRRYAEAHSELGFSGLGEIIKAHLPTFAEQISESSEIEEESDKIEGQKRKRGETEIDEPVKARSIFRPEKKARTDDGSAVNPASPKA